MQADIQLKWRGEETFLPISGASSTDPPKEDWAIYYNLDYLIRGVSTLSIKAAAILPSWKAGVFGVLQSPLDSPAKNL